MSTNRRVQIRVRRLVAVTAFLIAADSGRAFACVGDCSGDNRVNVSDIIKCVDIVLGNAELSTCSACSRDGQTVAISDVIVAVNNALSGCAPAPSDTATPVGGVTTLSGSCAAPGGHGPHGLKPCDAGTPITVFRCDNRTQCLHQQGLTMVGTTTVDNSGNGNWMVEIATTDASAALVFQANITDAVVYRALGFGAVANSAPGERASAVTFGPVDISPVTEAAAQLLDTNGFANYSDAGAKQVVTAVEQATANLSFQDVMPDMAAMLAVQTASADPMVMMVLQTARNTPTPTATATRIATGTNTPISTATATATATQTSTSTPTPTATATATATGTPTATPTNIRDVDNGDGTVTDTQTGLMWEKKDQGGGLHDESSLFVWAGTCSDNNSVRCQPDAAAAATCTTATGGAVGCAQCGGAATCQTSGKVTIWQWLNQLNAATFAGHSDWRIPTVGRDGGTAELETIVDVSAPGCSVSPFPPCVTSAFNTACTAGCMVTGCSCTQADYYWSATTDAAFPTGAWNVFFLNGGVGSNDKAGTLYVRAVRGVL